MAKYYQRGADGKMEEIAAMSVGEWLHKPNLPSQRERIATAVLAGMFANNEQSLSSRSESPTTERALAAADDLIAALNEGEKDG